MKYLLILFFPSFLFAQNAVDTLRVQNLLKDSINYKAYNNFKTKKDTAYLVQCIAYDVPMSIDEEFEYLLYISIFDISKVKAGQVFDLEKDSAKMKCSYWFTSTFFLNDCKDKIRGTIRVVALSEREIILEENIFFIAHNDWDPHKKELMIYKERHSFTLGSRPGW